MQESRSGGNIERGKAYRDSVAIRYLVVFPRIERWTDLPKRGLV